MVHMKEETLKRLLWNSFEKFISDQGGSIDSVMSLSDKLADLIANNPVEALKIMFPEEKNDGKLS